MGRPQIDGVVRYANNRINQAETRKLVEQLGKTGGDTAPPSPRILKERQMFNAKCFKGGNQAQHAGDAVGQLWLVGMLDIKGYDETKLLNAVRLWWRGREETYKHMGHKTATYERVSRTSSGTTKMSKLEKQFSRYQSLLMDADPGDQDLLADLMDTGLDGSPCMWAARIVQTEVLRHFILPVTVLAGAADYDKLAGIKRALLSMAGFEAIVHGEERNAA